MQVRRHIEVSGIVQGVGFRPYVYRLATQYRLAGTIRNTAAGVTIELQGPNKVVDRFIAGLTHELPPLASITHVEISEIPCNSDHEFRIISSSSEDAVRALISPDVATCDDCLRELFDPHDRRYRYPFINCTNCGPRFTITRNIPYDRPRTSMSVFAMCQDCQAEYENPLSRRFHAQPNACWNCGPRLELWDGQGKILNGNPIARAIAALKAGQVVAVKGLGGFHLAADATSTAAVGLLRTRKHRMEKPFAIMVPGIEAAESLCELSDTGCHVLKSFQRPIVLLRRKYPSPVADDVAPVNNYLGLFLPYTPLHHLLLADGRFRALVMTSANVSEEPIAIGNEEARTRLLGIADYFLVNNRDILLRCDDSVVRVVSGKIRQMRRSRGFVPVPLFLHTETPPILAVGGELKNTICLTKGTHAFLSQHVGDLENLEGYRFFEETVKHLQQVLEVRPKMIAYDLHPDYFSTKWALQRELPLIGVQHHHAHIASCMAENHLEGTVIGVAMDGTGYGSDGCIWGGEVLRAGYGSFERLAHFEYVPMPGGSAAIQEPWRMAVSYLAHHFGREFFQTQLPFLKGVPGPRLQLLLDLIERRVNSPLTSSCGRLFDAIAALAGIRRSVNYEAQAAIELEMAAEGSNSSRGYPFQLLANGDRWLIGTRLLFEAVLEDVLSGESASEISRRFHNGLIEILAQIAEAVRLRYSLARVCLSGGVFQNAYLLQQLNAKLVAAGFEVFTHREIPAGDGGLSLGQALVAAHFGHQKPGTAL
jgi:hydrogenase maturation protein HypF